MLLGEAKTFKKLKRAGKNSRSIAILKKLQSGLFRYFLKFISFNLVKEVENKFRLVMGRVVNFEKKLS